MTSRRTGHKRVKNKTPGGLRLAEKRSASAPRHEAESQLARQRGLFSYSTSGAFYSSNGVAICQRLHKNPNFLPKLGIRLGVMVETMVQMKQ